MSRRMQYTRALGWAAFTAAPPLLVALAVVSTRPEAPASLVTNTAIAAWIAGTLAFGASMLRQREARRAAWLLGGLAGAVVVGIGALLVRVAVVLGAPVAALEVEERAEPELRANGADERWVHPHLAFSLPALPVGMERSDAVEGEAARAGGPRWAEAHEVWAWQGLETEVTVDLARARRADREALAQLAADIEMELGGRASRADVGPLAVRFERRVPRGGHALTQVALFERNGRAYRLLVTVVTRDRALWARWLDGIRTVQPS
jgi:hypothetical protein